MSKQAQLSSSSTAPANGATNSPVNVSNNTLFVRIVSGPVILVTSKLIEGSGTNGIRYRIATLTTLFGANAVKDIKPAE